MHINDEPKVLMTPYKMVLEFHKMYDIPINVEMNSNELIGLRQDLMWEELDEVVMEITVGYECIDKMKLTKELADLMYVTIGTAVTFGLPLEEVFTEVHRSNMSKLGPDGKPIYREDGKVLKGPSYKEPNLEAFFEPQSTD